MKESCDLCFVFGQVVIFIGWGVGENYWGGLVIEVCVKGDWLVVLLEMFSVCQVMIIGIVGFIVMLCVDVFVSVGVIFDSGDILVIGVSGGVGSIVVVLFKVFGYWVMVVLGWELIYDYFC